MFVTRHPRALALCALATLAACQDASRSTLEPDAAPPAKKAAAPAPGTQVVMSGLNAPRGLAIGPDGALYVAESGTTQVNGPCAPTPPRGANCWSGTGSISRLWKGRQERVATGLPSIYNASALDISGPQHIDFQGLGNGYVTIGWGGDPAARAALGQYASLVGTLIRVRPNGKWSVEADVAGFERAANPDNEVFDSNPYGLLAEAGTQYVTDAGGNSLLRVGANGAISLVATFARVPAPAMFGGSSQAVPTNVRRGPDGALYVSTLTGVPFTTGAASVFRVADGGAPQPFATGFKTITDLAFGPDGSLYVLQYASGPGLFFAGAGKVVRVAPNGQRTDVVTGLTNPTGIVVADDGTIYVSNKGNVAGVGEVLRIVL